MALFQKITVTTILFGMAIITSTHAQEVPSNNPTAACPSLTTAIPEPLRQKTIQYEKALVERATPLCETNAKQANEFYLNGAKQLASFLVSSAISIESGCAPILEKNPLLPLQTIPNLKNAFHLEEGFDICAPDQPEPEETAEPEKTVSPPKPTEKLATPTPQETSTPITRERFEMDKQVFKRLRSTGAYITPEVEVYFKEMEAEFPPQSETSPASAE